MPELPAPRITFMRSALAAHFLVRFDFKQVAVSEPSFKKTTTKVIDFTAIARRIPIYELHIKP
jgi:hypothetical protein